MISTHILDTSIGSPAGGVKVSLHIKLGENWKPISSGVTNSDGRYSFGEIEAAGTYQMLFEVESYFKAAGRAHFFQNTPVIFKVDDPKLKLHVPLLLNPFGYSTYRGS